MYWVLAFRMNRKCSTMSRATCSNILSCWRAPETAMFWAWIITSCLRMCSIGSGEQVKGQGFRTSVGARFACDGPPVEL
ncbi:hypothetical protein M752DRAFT_273819 [Aspergillus phoenicis ATCC 13157]|uniref:Uncharacterized protein n=1 Tax=Aspergillus phoenicis ATCC 13157 TaxID=1353007 RepID=A0A370PTV0_ASPPH|nr:hypothetical protein M752DRAFT_273819 [Aspergillus phoenicis ATCC 13157]